MIDAKKLREQADGRKPMNLNLAELRELLDRLEAAERELSKAEKASSGWTQECILYMESVARWRTAWEVFAESGFEEMLEKAYAEDVTGSLTRLKAQWQAEILHKACNEGWWGSALRHKAFELEGQAGVARMSTEAQQLERRQAEEDGS